MEKLETIILGTTEEDIRKGADIIRSGGLVAFPTETVYGLGADALNPEAVKSIFEAKGRPGDNPLIVHIADIAELRPLIAAEPSDSAKKLMEAFWPGPLTLIFPRSELVPLATTGGLNTVAVRMPSHPVALALLKACNLPVAAPSANRSGKPSPTSAQHVFTDMDGRIPLIIDGGYSTAFLHTLPDMAEAYPNVPIILLRFGFNVLGLHRIEARYMVENTASRRVMDKLGFDFNWNSCIGGHVLLDPAFPLEVLEQFPDGSRIIGLARSQSHMHLSTMIYSDDEGETWSEPVELPGSLAGERHKAQYDPESGKLLITFREIQYDRNGDGMIASGDESRAERVCRDVWRMSEGLAERLDLRGQLRLWNRNPDFH